MIPSRETVQLLSDETGYQVDVLEKVLRLLDLLQDIASDPFLSSRLALKGGTALNVFHLSLDRLSVDIDLNYVGSLDRAVMMAERVTIDAALNRLLAAQGYSVRRQPNEHAGGKWQARYSSVLGGNVTLDVDVNYMMRQPLFGAGRMDSVSFGTMRANNVLVLDLHDVVAEKIVALVDRHTARDLFDARRILSIDEIDWQQIKAAVLAIGSSRRRDWRTVSAESIDVDLSEFQQKLAVCLPRGNFGGEGEAGLWIEETVAFCREKLAFLFDLTADEKEYLDRILDDGEIDASLLGVSPEMRARIEAMPMLAWKVQHVRKG